VDAGGARPPGLGTVVAEGRDMRQTRTTAGIALGTAIAFATTGCGRQWPSTYHASADPTFARRGVAVSTVDILPIDLDVWADDTRAPEGPQVRADATSTALGAIAASLAGAGYRVQSSIDWYGKYSGPGGTQEAMTAEDVLATAGSLAAYGAAASRSTGLPLPYLPVRLGEKTGADATLYVGGWSYLGEKGGDGDELATALLIAVGIIAVVAVVAVIADGKGGKSGKGVGRRHGGPSEPGSSEPRWSRGGGGRPRGHGGGGSLPGRALGAIGRATVATSRVALRTLATTTRVAVEVGADATRVMADATFRGAYADPYGPRTHIQIVVPPSCEDDPGVVGCPTTVAQWNAPPSKGKSKIYLEMTLVDNRTGHVLWHGRQKFPADAAKPGDVQRAIRGLMSTLPKAP
jgi:hypothetical protein